MCGCRDEGLLEPNGKTYMLSLKVYETVKTDVAYVQDKTVSQIQAKDRILEYLKHSRRLRIRKLKSCVGLTRIKPIISCTSVQGRHLAPDGVGRGTKYKSVK